MVPLSMLRSLRVDCTFVCLQSGIFCYCDNSFGSYGFSSECTKPCVGDFNQNCGGTISNQVYRVDGK